MSKTKTHHDFIAYIDEAGDDGFSRLNTGLPTGQSQFLMIGALVVDAATDKLIPQLRNEIAGNFPLRKHHQLHFCELKHEQKVVVARELAKVPFQGALTISNKATLPGSKWAKTFGAKGYLYNYLVRWLLERVTTACATYSGGSPCSLRVVFSRRKGMDYAAMRDYLCLMRDGRELMRPVRSIRWDVLDVDAVAVENHSNWAGLQLADCFTSAYFAGLEPNAYGDTETRYGDLLKGRLMRAGAGVLNCGLTPVPSLSQARLSSAQRDFILSCCK